MLIVAEDAVNFSLSCYEITAGVNGVSYGSQSLREREQTQKVCGHYRIEMLHSISMLHCLKLVGSCATIHKCKDVIIYIVSNFDHK